MHPGFDKNKASQLPLRQSGFRPHSSSHCFDKGPTPILLAPPSSSYLFLQLCSSILQTCPQSGIFQSLAIPRHNEEGWVVCRAFKKRTMHPPRGIVGAWDPSYPYHDPILVGAAHFKQEVAELDGAAAASALLQYSNRFVELPQLESPPPPNKNIQAASAEGEEDEDSRSGAAVTTDWRALDKFVASQLSPEEHTGQGLQECKPPGPDAGDDDDADMAALLLLDGGQEEDTGRWLGAGLLSSVADTADCGLGV